MHVVTTLLGKEAKLKGRQKLKEMRDSGVSMNCKYKNCKMITSAQIMCNTGNYGCNAELAAEVRRRRQVKIHEEQVRQQKKIKNITNFVPNQRTSYPSKPYLN